MPSFDLIHFNAAGACRTDMRCTSCDLCDEPLLQTNCMPPSGGSGVDFLFAGHAPGVEDDEIGSAMTGKNGRLLRVLVDEAGVEPSRIAYDNCLKCCPHETKIRDTQWKKCKGHFRNNLKIIKPKAIVSFGAMALRWLTGFSGPRRFRRRGLPCVLDESLVVYPMEQAISLQHYEGQEYYKARARMVSDFMWLKQKALAGTLHLVDDVKKDYKRAETLEDVRAFLDEFPSGTEVYADLENAEQDLNKGALFPHLDCRIVAVGFSNAPGHARTIPLQARGVKTLRYWSEEEEAQIVAWLDEFWRTHTFVGHNFVQYDGKWICSRWDIDQLDIPFEPMLASHLLDEEGGHGLEDLALRYTKISPWKKTFVVKDIRRCCEYLSKDVDAGSRLLPILREKLNPAQEWLHYNVQVPLAHEARRMEQRGVMIDVNAMETLRGHLEERITEEEKEIRTYKEIRAWELKNGCSFNPESTHHLRDLLKNWFKLPCIKKTDTGLYSTDREVLEFYEDACPFVGAILRRRRASKLYGTYYKNIKKRVDEHGSIIHYSMNLHGTVTGRPSFSDPNVGNIPRKDTAEKAGIQDPALVKAMFAARPGYTFVQLDYSQAELRTLAMYSKDTGLIEIYLKNQDVHAATAARVYGVPLELVTPAQRSNAKKTNFGIIYGKQEESLIQDFVTAARELERLAAKKDGRTPSFTPKMEAYATSEAQGFLKAHKEAHPGVWRWLHEQERQIRRHGYQETFFGRRRHYHKIDNAAIRQAFNFPIQSTAAEFLHIALVRCARILRALEMNAYPALTVYDSIVFECRTEDVDALVDIVKPIMEGLEFDFMSVPMKIDVEVGPSWGRLKNWKAA